MVYTVTFNLSLDYIVTVQDFMMGIVNRTSREMIFPGGKGITTDFIHVKEGNSRINVKLRAQKETEINGQGHVINSVGAGDSMVAGFLYGYGKTGSYEEAFQYGICTGSASAFSEELATKEEVETLMGRSAEEI